MRQSGCRSRADFTVDRSRASLGEEGAIAMLARGVLYLVGMFAVTMVFNLPLNATLAAVDYVRPQIAERRFLGRSEKIS
jgi:hypothetical protein